MIIESVANLEAVLTASFIKRCEIKVYLISRGTKVTWPDQVLLLQHKEIKQMQEPHRNAAVQQDLLRRSQSLEMAYRSLDNKRNRRVQILQAIRQIH